MDYQAEIENLYARLAEGDFQSIFDIVDPSAEWIEAENIPYSPGHPIIGHDAIQKEVFDRLGNDMSEFQINVTKITAGGNTVVVEGRYVGTPTRSDLPLDAIFAHVWDFAGQKVVRFQQYSDTWQWRRVLGVDG